IWTQGQGTDNRHWIPGYDDENDKLITEMIITFDKNYQVISNGNLISVTDNRDNKTKTWHYAMNKPHAFYLMQLAIGEYAVKEYPSKSGIISSQYYYPDRAETLEPTYGVSTELMDWMESEIGVPYPWDTYANIPVQEFLYGAMENTTATIFTDYMMQDARAADDRSYHSTNAHELAHMWFGDLVTEWSGTHHWLHESFATHYAKKFMEYRYGDDFFQWRRRDEMISAFGADAKDEFPLAHSEAGGARHYPKGSIVLDMLRYVVGDAQYRKVVKEYLEKHAYTNVTTHDFYLQFAETLGMNLDWFFDEWIYKAGYPEYTISYSATSDSTIIEVSQTQKQTQTVGLFKMPIIMQVHYTDGSFDEKKAWIENEKTNVAIPNPLHKTIAFVLFDPNSQVYASVNFKKEFSELRYQAYNAPNMMDRFDAITDMRNISLDTKREDLIAIYYKETWHGIKS
ncbi:MAG: M1 family metallopeptidase, partial [Chitinophagales bacterium]